MGFSEGDSMGSLNGDRYRIVEEGSARVPRLRVCPGLQWSGIWGHHFACCDAATYPQFWGIAGRALWRTLETRFVELLPRELLPRHDEIDQTAAAPKKQMEIVQ